ncbi:MMPL family transporter [Rodentibacter abscessus]|uniref:MMPL family transporter n=1 Tax=Rodentibacter abscessus TaxID=3381777 RepID=UPI00399CEC7D
MSRYLTVCRTLYALMIIGAMLFLGLQIQKNNLLETDLKALLPQEQHWSMVQSQADQIQERQLNRQFIALIGHSNNAKAFTLAEQLSKQWQKSHLFTRIDSKFQPNISQLQQEIDSLSIAGLPENQRNLLLKNAKGYFQQYAEHIVNPFAQTGLIPIERDWLGFGRFINQNRLSPNIQWNAENGMVFISADKYTWVLLRAELNQQDFFTPNQSLLKFTEQNRQFIEAQQGELLLASTSLFSAYAKQQAEKESILMSTLGIGLTLLLLVSVFRTLRVLWLFLPIVVGMLFGVVATLLFFGQIHILTLVVGTSLVGVLIDFPLHWLSSSLFNLNWQPQQAMNRLRFTFFISLFVTLLGYGLLGFTPLPVLKQTALFSAFALIGAICATLLYLPLLFKNYRPNKLSNPFEPFQVTLNKKTKISLVVALLIFVGVGLSKSKWQDDIRQWIAMPPQLVAQLQQIAKLTGIDFGSQYFLVVAENDNALLEQSRRLSRQLENRQIAHQSLSQWLLSEDEQKNFIAEVSQKISSEDYAVLEEIGIPLGAVEKSLKNLANKPLINLQQALKTQLGQAWQSLYLGDLGDNHIGGIVKIKNSQNITALTELADNQHIFLQDKRASLNLSFQETRNQAAWLKLLSFLFAGLLLWKYFGLKKSAKMLLIPFSAIIMTVAIFGWFNLPISLFVMFGLLLVSAIGIDYTAYMQTAKEPLADKKVSILLACCTTLISFILLGLSTTPAVSAFGLSVGIGIVLTLFMTFYYVQE